MKNIKLNPIFLLFIALMICIAPACNNVQRPSNTIEIVYVNDTTLRINGVTVYVKDTADFFNHVNR